MTRLGLAEHSYVKRIEPGGAYVDRVAILRHAAELGAGGGQISIAGWDQRVAAEVKALCARTGIYVEAEARLPRDRADGARFERELRAFRAAGGTIARVVAHGGRRYEEFTDRASYDTWARDAFARTALALQIAHRCGVALAVENHKDLGAAELLDWVRRLPGLGVCVDTGNNLALLEDPAVTIDALAPHALTCQIKDMAVQPAPQGFLLSEVPLGAGALDLPALVARLRRARPQIRFNLEMLTRDPLVIPCLTDRYWATMSDVPAPRLAATLAWVRARAAPALPRVTGLDDQAHLAVEEENVVRSLAYARASLGL